MTDNPSKCSCGHTQEWHTIKGRIDACHFGNCLCENFKPCSVVTTPQKSDNSRLLTDEIESTIVKVFEMMEDEEDSCPPHEEGKCLLDSTEETRSNACKYCWAKYLLTLINPQAFAAGEKTQLAIDLPTIDKAIKEIAVWSKKVAELDAQKEKDQQEINELKQRIIKVENRSCKALAEARKQGAREFEMWCHTPCPHSKKKYHMECCECWQAKLKELETT